ncbi:MAG: class I SAM-dependent methyltransferase [Spirochaetales bacterium]|nr:class I SAM-dependent methyltransferase [Spirochaetales bacterium]
MIESKAWNWDANASDYWKTVVPEFLPVGLEWRAKGLRRALDLGCGLGRNAIFLAQNGFDVCAFDLSKEGVAELGLRVETAVGDMLDLPYAEDAIDCVVAFHSIYHTDLEGLRRVVARIRRVLVPGGELFVTLNSTKSDAWRLFADRRIDDHTLLKTEGPEVDVPYTYLDFDDVSSLLDEFTILNIREIIDFWEGRRHGHFFVRCRKQ